MVVVVILKICISIRIFTIRLIFFRRSIVVLVPIGDDDDYDDEYPRVRCENVAKSSKNCAIRAVFRRRPPQALLVVKID